MSNLDRYRPARESYQPPSLPQIRPHADRTSKSPVRRREVPPAAPSPPTHTSRTSPPRPPSSRRSAPAPSPAPAPHSSPSQPAARPPPRPNQWLFTTDEVASAPSIVDGLPVAEERLRRAKGVNFIYQAGILLELPTVTLWVAGVFFHRFYMRYSMLEEKGGSHHYNIAATALFLANKTEENCRKTKDLIVAVVRVAQKDAKLYIDEQSKEYWRWRDNILAYEEVMLETLTFDLMIDNPYQRLYEHLEQLGLLRNKRLRESAWAFCNDSCLTVIPLMMEARDVSIAAIFWATTITREKIPDVNGEAWWKRLKGTEELAAKAVDVMVEFYRENPLKKQDSKYPGSPEFILENTRIRGETLYSQTEAGSSQNGTPMVTDRGTQSPRGTRGHANGRTEREYDAAGTKNDSGSGYDANVEMASQPSRGGDSDAALKSAANDVGIHDRHPNGSKARSPGGKRKDLELDPESETERDQKRARTVDPSNGESAP